MTAADLIARLRELPPDCSVQIHDVSTGQFEPIERVVSRIPTPAQAETGQRAFAFLTTD